MAVIVENRLVFCVVVVQTAANSVSNRKSSVINGVIIVFLSTSGQMFICNVDKVITPISLSRRFFRELDQ
ncbi:Uncharacterised protein [Kluyvera cryocrescens]|uniref:Uncharacterized protein n=1 Tax=Kluyvera cryocrescens TaxID=580 RepID=A0A485AFF7_KLUCR|nr:Uncharacterised protein [Kluyvera cryocrescens]